MKNIKLFENFDQYDYWHYASMKKIKQDINDMFIELVDDGFEVDTKFISTLQVYIEGKDDWFFFDKIYETVLMLIDYVENEFEDVKVIFDYEEYNESSYMKTRDWKQGTMERLFNNETENKHFLISYFSIEFETGNKKLI
jgi:hypothetical protein